MPEGHFEPLNTEGRVLVESLSRAIAASELFFDSLASSNYVASASGFKIDTDGTAEFNAGMTIGGGAVIDDVSITGTLTMNTGALLKTGPAGSNRMEFNNAEGWLEIYNTADTLKGYIGLSPTGYGADTLVMSTEGNTDPIRIDADGSVDIFAGGSAGTSLAVYGEGAGGAPISVAKFYDYSANPTASLVMDVKGNGVEFSQPAKFADGAVGAPSMTFKATGQTDVGFWRSDTDKLNVSIGGSEVWEWGAATHISTEPLWLPAGAVSATSIQLNDADTGLYSTGTGVADVAAAGARVQAWNADGPMVENAITKFPSQVSATPAQITTFASTNWIAGTSYTLWTHSGTGRDVWVSAIARFEWGETAAVAYTGECRLGISFNGGSTWNYGATSIHYVGTGTGGGGYRGSGTVIYEGQAAAAAVTGDIQMRLEHKVSNTSMDRLVNQHIMGRVEQIF